MSEMSPTEYHSRKAAEMRLSQLGFEASVEPDYSEEEVDGRIISQLYYRKPTPTGRPVGTTDNAYEWMCSKDLLLKVGERICIELVERNSEVQEPLSVRASLESISNRAEEIQKEAQSVIKRLKDFEV